MKTSLASQGGSISGSILCKENIKHIHFQVFLVSVERIKLLELTKASYSLFLPFKNDSFSCGLL
ncbi:hypothetical protein SacN8_10585 [Sulfolobus acidocaldarius N8]|uniref:Uncharacterized protein n=2 Tax=Sulfolobus acidocaldarius TaxID=2285 RepID=M1IG62_9CREN|nr:hypothetical protein SacN8_10585 [Sulfolobus acidocaldarius N8]AGE74383.1 hypothetical protein SacRon12I_10835 [Sulfolobus acidocaldarius Ron12/I]WCM33839.1 hypothetical protein GO597_00040 [Sulfolobus acidocaldarius DSM 639]